MKNPIIYTEDKYTIHQLKASEQYELRSTGILICVDRLDIVKSKLTALLVVDKLNSIKNEFMGGLQTQLSTIIEIVAERKPMLEIKGSTTSVNRLDEISSNLNEIYLAMEKFLNKIN